MSTQTICNKCRKEIETGIKINNNTNVLADTPPPYYVVKVIEYKAGGAFADEKEYHLCKYCHEDFKKYMDSYTEKNDLTSEELDNMLIKGSENINDNYKCIIAHSGINSNNRQYTAYTLGDHVIPIENTIQIGNMLKPLKSDMIIGNVHIYNTKKFNKLEKFMWKKFFGFEIKEINNNE